MMIYEELFVLAEKTQKSYYDKVADSIFKKHVAKS